MIKIILTIGTIQALAICIQFIKSKFVAVYLGPAGVGIISTIDQFVQLVAYISCLSLPATSLKFLSKSHSQSESIFKATYASFFKLILLLTMVGAIVTISIIFFDEDILGAELKQYKLFLILGLLTLPTFTLNTFFINVFAAAEKYKASSIFVVIINIAGLIASLAGVITAGLFGLYFGNILAGIILSLGVLIYFYKSLNLPFFNPRAKILEEFKRSPDIPLVAMMLYFGAIAASLAFLVARYSVLKNFGEVEAGLLHGVIALSFALGMALNPAINLYLTPIINRDIEKAEKVEHSINFQKKLIFILGAATLLVLMFPKLMLTIMFSEKFAEVSPLLFYFVISQFILQLASVQQALLIGVDDAKFYMIITTIGQLIFAFLCFVTVPILGIKGAGVAQIVGNSFIFVVTLIRLRANHNYKVPMKVILLQSYVLSVLILAGLICNQVAETSSLIILIKLGFTILFVSSFLLFFNPEELAYVSNIQKKYLFRK